MEAKQCAHCKELKCCTEFYRHPNNTDGLQAYCKVCSTARARLCEKTPAHQPRRRDAIKRTRIKFPEKDRARRLVQYAKEAGRLTAKPCEVCGAGQTEAHHNDYSKPLDVRWLCKPHHRQLHAPKNGAAS